MLRWDVIGFAAFVALVLYYWYNPRIFKVLPEKKYPETFGKHPDPHKYKKHYR
jgi:hypothetical protein